MCLVLFAYQVHPQFPLIVAANRDEFYNRKTAQASFWKDHPYIVGGRDLEQMGTWMGVTKQGRFSALTNYRNPQDVKKNKKSRGYLVRNYLTSNEETFAYLKNTQKEKKSYQGYNLIVGTPTSLWYYSNIEDKIRELVPGIYGLSNHLLNTAWPKVEKGIDGLRSIIEKSEFNPEDLFCLLRQSDPAPKQLLPNTGISDELELNLSPLFITMEHYGTRASTVLTINKESVAQFHERTYSKKGLVNNTFTFQIEKGKAQAD